MEQTNFLVFFAIGLIAFFMSTRRNSADASNTFQVQISMINMVIWIAVVMASFNIEYLVWDGEQAIAVSRIDYAFVGLSIGMFIFSLINVLILFTYGSYNKLYKLVKN